MKGDGKKPSRLMPNVRLIKNETHIIHSHFAVYTNGVLYA